MGTETRLGVEGDVQHPEPGESLCLENEAKLEAMAERGAPRCTRRGRAEAAV